MKYLGLLICTIAAAAVVVSAERVSYHNYKIYSVFFNTEEQFQIMSDMRTHDSNVHFMQLYHKLKFAEIMVAPEKVEQFLAKITSYGMTYELLIDNVENNLKENQ